MVKKSDKHRIKTAFAFTALLGWKVVQLGRVGWECLKATIWKQIVLNISLFASKKTINSVHVHHLAMKHYAHYHYFA